RKRSITGARPSPCASTLRSSSLHSPYFVCPAAATTELYTLSLHDALPIYEGGGAGPSRDVRFISELIDTLEARYNIDPLGDESRSEEHTSELQSRFDLVCRLLLEKKKVKITTVNAREIIDSRGNSTIEDDW